MMDLNKLKALAVAATPGPWVCFNDCIEIGESVTLVHCMGSSFNKDGQSVDAAFIAAANPSTVLELIALSERIQAELTAERAAKAQGAADPVVEANRALLLERSQVGMAKYGTTLAGADLGRSQLLRHLLEELLDAANYAQAELMRASAAPSIQAQGALTDEREEFERVERSNSSNMKRQKDGQYENPCTQSAWEGWQARAALAPSIQALPVVASDLHAAIMNLPCKPGRAIAMRPASLQVYKEGHRDARHAAAELAAAQPEAKQAPGDTCLHDDTVRLGAIWTKCEQCGKLWADDEGGMPKREEAKEAPAALSDSIAANVDFQEDLIRLSAPGLSRKQAKVIRTEIYRTIDARVRNAVLAAAGNSQDAKDAARWRFMLRVTDDEQGPEALAIENLGNEFMEDDRPNSVQMVELTDAAIAAMAAAPSPAEPT